MAAILNFSVANVFFPNKELNIYENLGSAKVFGEISN